MLLHEPCGGDVEDAGDAVVEADADAVLRGMIRDAGCQLIGRVELVQLLHGIERPHADRAVRRHGRDLVSVGIHRHVEDRVGVRAQQGAITVRRNIQHAHRSARGEGGDGEPVGRNANGSDGGFMLGLEEVVREVDRPHAEVSIIGARDAEALVDDDRVDWPVVQLEDSFERAAAVVDLEDSAAGRRNEAVTLLDFFEPIVHLEGDVSEGVVRGTWRQAGARLGGHLAVFSEVDAAAAQPAVFEAVEADRVAAAGDQMVLFEG